MTTADEAIARPAIAEPHTVELNKRPFGRWFRDLGWRHLVAFRVSGVPSIAS